MFTTAEAAFGSRHAWRMMIATVLAAGAIGIATAGMLSLPKAPVGGTQLDPLRMMMEQKDLPAQHIVDLSLIFE
jgi:hypothetical protein